MSVTILMIYEFLETLVFLWCQNFPENRYYIGQMCHFVLMPGAGHHYYTYICTVPVALAHNLDKSIIRQGVVKAKFSVESNFL
jgi:hypothetical protein